MTGKFTKNRFWIRFSVKFPIFCQISNFLSDFWLDFRFRFSKSVFGPVFGQVFGTFYSLILDPDIRTVAEEFWVPVRPRRTRITTTIITITTMRPLVVPRTGAGKRNHRGQSHQRPRRPRVPTSVKMRSNRSNTMTHPLTNIRPRPYLLQ